MYQPETYAIALSFMMVTMLCWGSWANTIKLCPGYRFQLFYWDYVIGLLGGALFWGATLGSLGTTGRSFLADVSHVDATHLAFAVLSGVLFNVANLLLVAGIDLAGLAVAFPVGIGVALVVGAVSSYIVTPRGNPLVLFAGVALVATAIVSDAVAYALREKKQSSTSTRGVILSLTAGLLMGSFYPFASKAMTGQDAPGPYATALFFVFGVALCALPLNYLLMRRPLTSGEPVAMEAYGQAPLAWHLWGVLGGAIWCTGAILNFVASRVHVVGPAVSYSIGQGATLVSACCGVFVWREFANAPARSKAFLAWMFVFFVCGLVAVALAPIL